MIELEFEFRNIETGETITVSEEFDVTASLEHDIDAFCDDWMEENDGEWELDERTITDWDDDFMHPSKFDNLDEYGEYMEKCAEHGEAYHLRYEDVGDFNFDDSYDGCWDSEEEFAQHLIEECYEIPDHIASYIDWEKWARDVMMDYSSYDGSEGVHIFRD